MSEGRDTGGKPGGAFSSAREWAKNNLTRGGGPGGINWFWVIIFVLLLIIILYVYIKYTSLSTEVSSVPAVEASEKKLAPGRVEEPLTIQSLRERKGVTMT